MLEKQIEKTVCDYAKAKGMIVYKFSSPGYTSVPDRMFICNSGYMFMIEFKSTKGKVTANQQREHNKLRDYGISVHVVNNIEQGKALIDKEWLAMS